MTSTTIETPTVTPVVTNLDGSISHPFTVLGWQGASARKTGKSMLLAALNGQKPEDAARITEEARCSFRIGYVAGQLAPEGSLITEEYLSLARTVIGKSGKDRDETEASAVAAAQKAWSRIKDDAGMGNLDGRGAKRQRAQEGAEKDAKKAAETVKQAVTKEHVPVLNDVHSAHAYLRDVGSVLVALAEKNPRTIAGKALEAIRAFGKAMHDLPDVEPSVRRQRTERTAADDTK